MKYIVQVYCSDMGWVDSKYGADTYPQALNARDTLLATDSAWVNPDVERQTRILIADPK